MNKQLSIGIVLIVVVLAALAWYFTQPSVPFAVSSSDQPISWTLPLPQDAASSTPRLRDQIAQFRNMLGQGQYPDADIHTAIANNYALIGDGKGAYHSYLDALSASSSDALVYDNLGGLFARLHATTTATRAYAKAVELAPEQLLFQLSYLDYLIEVAPGAPTTALAFAAAKAQSGGDKNPNLLIAEANWLDTVGSTTGAISDWRKVEELEPGAAASIEARIAQLKKK